jgi:hypothetical protein
MLAGLSREDLRVSRSGIVFLTRAGRSSRSRAAGRRGLRFDPSRSSLRSNEIAELRHRDASQAECTSRGSDQRVHRTPVTLVTPALPIPGAKCIARPTTARSHRAARWQGRGTPRAERSHHGFRASFPASVSWRLSAAFPTRRALSTPSSGALCRALRSQTVLRSCNLADALAPDIVRPRDPQMGAESPMGRRRRRCPGARHRGGHHRELQPAVIGHPNSAGGTLDGWVSASTASLDPYRVPGADSFGDHRVLRIGAGAAHRRRRCAPPG